ncbi:hypothetical protein BDV06DRAFT_227473 [Aspergillus oleicola]
MQRRFANIQIDLSLLKNITISPGGQTARPNGYKAGLWEERSMTTYGIKTPSLREVQRVLDLWELVLVVATAFWKAFTEW